MAQIDLRRFLLARYFRQSTTVKKSSRHAPAVHMLLEVELCRDHLEVILFRSSGTQTARLRYVRRLMAFHDTEPIAIPRVVFQNFPKCFKRYVYRLPSVILAGTCSADCFGGESPRLVAHVHGQRVIVDRRDLTRIPPPPPSRRSCLTNDSVRSLRRPYVYIPNGM